MKTPNKRHDVLDVRQTKRNITWIWNTNMTSYIGMILEDTIIYNVKGVKEPIKKKRIFYKNLTSFLTFWCFLVLLRIPHGRLCHKTNAMALVMVTMRTARISLPMRRRPLKIRKTRKMTSKTTGKKKTRLPYTYSAKGPRNKSWNSISPDKYVIQKKFKG